MTPEVLEALKGSIKKWEDIVAGTGEDRGVWDCPLCQLFIDAFGRDLNCEICPVMEATENFLCEGTPYEEWTDHQEEMHYWESGPDKIRCPECESLAYAELDFLRGLLPEGGE